MLKEIGYRNLNGLNVLLPKINHFLSKIEDGFSFIKVNHGFWCLASGDSYWGDPYLKIFDKLLLDEVKKIIFNIKKYDIDLAISPVGAPQQIHTKISDLSEFIKKSLPSDYLPYYAVCWKIYALSGDLTNFLEKIIEKKIIVVGLEHLLEINKKFPNHSIENFVLNFESSKPFNRNKVFEELKEKIKPNTVFLFQAGDILSTWLIHKLSSYRVKTCSLIDMGRALDYYCSNKYLNKKDSELYPLPLDNFYDQPWLRK